MVSLKGETVFEHRSVFIKVRSSRSVTVPAPDRTVALRELCDWSTPSHLGLGQFFGGSVKFVFLIDKTEPIPGKKHWYQCLNFRVEAPTREEAYDSIKSQIPEGHRMFCYYEDKEEL